MFLSFDYSANTPSEELHLPKVVQRRDVVRALILAGTNSDNLIKRLDLRGIPYVALGNTIIGDAESAGSNLIFSDDVQGSAYMTRYLIGIGHRHLCFAGNLRQPWHARCSPLFWWRSWDRLRS